jgi:hypothetical protein
MAHVGLIIGSSFYFSLEIVLLAVRECLGLKAETREKAGLGDLFYST